jgi:hypothetical protein
MECGLRWTVAYITSREEDNHAVAAAATVNGDVPPGATDQSSEIGRIGSIG